MRISIIAFLVFLFTAIANAKIAFDQYDFTDVVVIVTTHDVINTAWKMIGGQRKWKEVYAFSYFDHKKNKYYVYLPVGASEALIGHEFAHILKWKGANVREVKAEDKK